MVRSFVYLNNETIKIKQFRTKINRKHKNRRQRMIRCTKIHTFNLARVIFISIYFLIYYPPPPPIFYFAKFATNNSAE